MPVPETPTFPRTDLGRRMDQLVSARRPFVHATVVRAQPPTSARAGDAAIVLDDGSIEGFVGGQCAQTSVRSAALGTLRDGKTVLLRVLPDGAAEFPDSPGAQVVVNPCLSGGALEIFLRPMLPPPVLHVLGRTPIGEAVAAQAGLLEFVVEREPAEDTWTGAVAVIVASLGRDEQTAIRSALDAGVGYIGLVASRRRGTEVLDGMGLTEAERSRIHTPVGLDIGARTAPEIALSVLAEVVQAIRVGGLRAPSTTPGQPGAHGVPVTAREATDPVCGMTVVVGPETPHLRLDDQDYWFCCPGCRRSFADQRAAAR